MSNLYMGLIYVANLWPKRSIPYVITRTANRLFGNAIRSAIKHWNQTTTINIVPFVDYIQKTGDVLTKYMKFNFSLFKVNPSCSSDVENTKDVQTVTCGPSRIGKSINSLTRAYIHEIGHALRFKHEQQRHDRNKHVIANPLLLGKRRGDYEIVKPPNYLPHGEYDCESVMHYRLKSPGFIQHPDSTCSIGPTKENMPTISGGTISTWISDGDIATINFFYKKKPLW